MKRDYYEILGVSKTGSLDEIKKSYRKLALQFHPDRNPNNPAAEEKFKEAAEAYSVLSDNEKRQKYDQFGHAGLGGSSQQFDPGQFRDFEDILGSFFGGGIFGDIFGQGQQGFENRGSDIQTAVAVPFKVSIFGKESHEITIPKLASCSSCEGSGCQPGTGPQTCSQCQGTGQNRVRQGPFQMVVTCSRCQGRGKLIPNPCKKCHGEGRVKERSVVSFRIPAGVDQGTRLRLNGKGESGINGGPSGDLYIVFEVEEDQTYTRDGEDLHQSLDIPWPIFVLGGKVPIETLYGPDEVAITAGTASDKVIRIPSGGVPRIKHAGRGDLYLHLRAEVPKELTEDQRKIIEQLRNVSPSVNSKESKEESLFSKMFSPPKKKKKN